VPLTLEIANMYGFIYFVIDCEKSRYTARHVRQSTLSNERWTLL